MPFSIKRRDGFIDVRHSIKATNHGYNKVIRKEWSTVKILIGLCFLAIAFIDYCCCRAATLADQQLEGLASTFFQGGEDDRPS
jgi:hypothetical protein